jgi:hypothetical protein
MLRISFLVCTLLLLAQFVLLWHTATGSHFMNLSMPPSVSFNGVLTDANGKPPNQREIAMANSLTISDADELPNRRVGARQRFLIRQKDNAKMLAAGLLPEA